MILKVTKECIDKGKRFTASACPVALAMSKAGFPGIDAYPHGLFFDARTDDGYERVRIDVPSRMASFMQDFDAGWTVKPTSFRIRIPRSTP